MPDPFQRNRFVCFLTTLAILLFPTLFILVPVAAEAASCSLSITATPSASSVSFNQSFSYAVTIKNTGTAVCQNTSVMAVYGENEEFLESTRVPVSGKINKWLLNNLASGKNISFSITTQNDDVNNSAFSNSICVSATNGSRVCANNTLNTGKITPVAPVSLPVTSDTTDTPTPPISTPPSPKNDEDGIWVWTSPVDLTTSQMNAYIGAAAKGGFNTIYLTVDDYLDISNMQNGIKKNQADTAYQTAVQNFITLANKNNIKVYAESGWRDWAEQENQWKAITMMDFVASYNNTHPAAQFFGVEYDVEPYLLPTYESNKSPLLYDYIDWINNLVAHDTYNLPIQLVIPHFYGTGDNWTPNITYKGTTGSTFSLLLKALDTRPGSSMNIMSYRNYTNGSDGSITISSAEMNEISSGHHSTKLIIAQETGNVDPGYVTFYGMTKSALNAQISLIKNAFSSDSGFGGIAVDYIDPYMALKN